MRGEDLLLSTGEYKESTMLKVQFHVKLGKMEREVITENTGHVRTKVVMSSSSKKYSEVENWILNGFRSIYGDQCWKADRARFVKLS